MSTPPTNNLLRAYCADDAAEYRASEDGRDILRGHFAVWNEWTTINSRYEGHFLERIAPGAFDQSIAQRAPVILFQHGSDPTVGMKPLGDVRSMKADERGMAYEVALHDATYVNDLKPAFRSGMGASFKFSIPDGGDHWETPSRATAGNPDRLPERTITNATLYEFGPVTFPAYEGATAGMRSMTDEFMGEWLRDSAFVARLTDRVGLTVVEKILATAEDLRDATPEQETQVDDRDAAHAKARRSWLASNLYS